MLSSKVKKRRQENWRYKGKIQMWRFKFDQHKAYRIFKCKGCGRRIRVPRGKGKAELEDLKLKIREQERLYQLPKTKILLAGHSYMIQDEYIGKPILRMLEKMDVVPIRADIIDRKMALEQSLKLSPTLKWEINREIVGSVYKNRERRWNYSSQCISVWTGFYG